MTTLSSAAIERSFWLLVELRVLIQEDRKEVEVAPACGSGGLRNGRAARTGRMGLVHAYGDDHAGDRGERGNGPDRGCNPGRVGDDPRDDRADGEAAVTP